MRRKRNVRPIKYVKKSCYFCDNNLDPDYKRIDLLQKFLTPRKKIIPRRGSGLCAKHQRKFSIAVKRVRNIALI